MDTKSKRYLLRDFERFLLGLDQGYTIFNSPSPWRNALTTYYSRESPTMGLCFVALSIRSGSDDSSFTLQFGWSNLKRIPEVSSSFFALDREIDMLKRHDHLEYFQRVRVFFGYDKWWRYSVMDSSESDLNLKEANEILKERIIPSILKLERIRAENNQSGEAFDDS